MAYRSGCDTTFHHRYHLVWAPKYRFKVLHGEDRLRVREIIRQVCDETGVTIVNGALSRDHDHMFIENPPHVSESDFVRRARTYEILLNMSPAEVANFKNRQVIHQVFGPSM